MDYSKMPQASTPISSRAVKRSLLCIIVLLLAEFTTGCSFEESVHEYGVVRGSVVAGENGAVLRFHFVSTGRTFASNGVLVRERRALNGNEVAATDDVLPLYSPSKHPNQEELDRLFYSAPEYRLPGQLISFASSVNRELADGKKCYVIGTNPMIIGFDVKSNILADERFWLKVKQPSDPLAPQLPGSPAVHISSRFAEFVNDSMLEIKLGGLAIYPPRATEPDQSVKKSTVQLLQFRHPQQISEILKANCDVRRFLPEVESNMTVPVRFAWE